MTLPMWRPVHSQHKEVVTNMGDGINTAVPAFDIKDSEASYLRNMDSDQYPAGTCRPGRTVYGTTAENSTQINGLGQRNNEQIHIVDGNSWKYRVTSSTSWTTLTTTLTSTEPAEFYEFATGTNRYTLCLNSTQKKIWDGTSTALDLGDSTTPNSRIGAVHKGRIYLARDNDIKFCALNATTDWTTANDAGSIDITRAKGDIIAEVEYGDHVIAFTEFSMHELFGTGPLNYQMVDVEGDVGCISNRSIIACNGRLYWLDYKGVYEYTGGSPRKVSDAVDAYLEDINLTHKTKCVAGAINEHLYLSIPYGSGVTQNNLLLHYNTRLGKWYPDTGNFTDFVTIANTLYGVDTAGTIWQLRSGTDDGGTGIAWEFITKPFNDASIQGKKTLTDMWLVVDRTTDSTSFSIGYSTNVENTDSTSFTTISSTLATSSNIQNARVQIPLTNLQNVNWYRLRFAGTGPATIYQLQKNFRVKAR